MLNRISLKIKEWRRETWGLIALIALLLTYSGTAQLQKQLIPTGDEPRYLTYSLGLHFHGRPLPSSSEWNAISEEFNKRHSSGWTIYSEAPHPPPPWHAIALSALGSPLVFHFGVAGIRGLSVIIGIAGFAALYRLIIYLGIGPVAASFSCIVGAVSLPLVPYWHLFLPEIILFSLASWGLLLSLKFPPSSPGFIVGIALGLLAPLFHLRGAATAAIVGSIGFWRLARESGLRDARSALRLGVYSILCLVLLGLIGLVHHLANGSILGPVTTARPALNTTTLALALFDFRHGLLIYAPHFFLGFIGLALAALRRTPWVWPMLAFTALWACTSLGPYPGECWPARFWIQISPVFIVGMAYSIAESRTVAERVCIGLFVIMGLANSALFLWRPNAYLENRSLSQVYYLLNEIMPQFHFGLWVDTWHNYVRPEAVLTAFAGVIVVWLVGLFFRLKWTAIGMIALIAVALDSHRVTPIAITEVQASAGELRFTAEGLRAHRLLRLDLLPPWTPISANTTIQVQTDGILIYAGPFKSPLMFKAPEFTSLRSNWIVQATDADVRLDFVRLTQSNSLLPNWSGFDK